MPGFPIHHQLSKFVQTHVHWVGDAIQPSNPLLSLSPPAFNLFTIRVFSNEAALYIKWPKYWSFSFCISPSNDISKLISFRIDWFDLLAVQETLISSPKPPFKSINFWHSASLMVQCSHPYLTTGKTIALTRWTFVSKVMSLLFNTLSRFVTAFLPRSNSLFNFMPTVTIYTDFGAQENKVCHCCHCFPPICHEVMGSVAIIFIIWMLSFKPVFPFSFCTFIKRLFSSSSFSAIKVVSSAYQRLLIYLLAIVIPAYASSSPTFHMIYSTYMFNMQSDDIQPWQTPFPIWNQFVVPGLVLTVACLPAYRFLRKQVRWSGICISLGIFHSLLRSTQSLWHSQWSRSRCFSGTLLPFLWFNRCWQFVLWFLCLF